MSFDKFIPVKVAVRCRPLVPREVADGCQQCLYFVKGEPQVIVGNNRPFTFDYTFSAETSQEDVYESAVNDLLQGLFKGFNATVLAYGQTGSGKTYTMGSSYHPEQAPDSSTLGIIPRVVKSLFKQANEDNQHEFLVRVSFLELYNEDIIDLFVPLEKRETMVLREDPNNGIKIPGLKEITVQNLQETMDLLRQGSIGRTTGATAMNSQSSRSHAIFTIHVDQFNKLDENDIWKAKFHLVDLAGSERVKKTMATGDRFKEGVNINKGLLMLGNVISALGSERGKSAHIPYRDSKLTRLLQDSLGGNSNTMMIACVSPADNNMEETLNTLRYADRARKIKNKPVVNRDPQAAEILRLRQLVQELQMRSLPVDPSTRYEAETSKNFNQSKIKSLEEENMKLSHELQLAVAQNSLMCEKVIHLEMTRDALNEKIAGLKKQAQFDIEALNSSMINGDMTQVNEQLEKIKDIQSQISDLQNTSLSEMKMTDEDSNNDQGNHDYTVSDSDGKNHALRQAKLSRELQELNKLLATKQELADQISLNDSHMDEIRSKYEETMKQLEENVSKLQVEKAKLENELQQAKANTSSNKVAEQRRKRLQELEGELQKMRKKMAEQNKLVKMKEQSDKQVKKLDIDIKSLKVHRVKLMKQMKVEGDNFRKWKQEKDREVMQLKAKDRKREFQIARLVQRNEQQKKVLQRKAEEAAAANRRLKEALNKQHQRTLEEKEHSSDRKSGSTSIGTRIKKWLTQEIEVLVSLEEAQHHLNELREDRKELTRQLQELNERQDSVNTEPPSKRKTMDARNECKVSERNSINKQIADIKQDIDLRNAQIQDLQQKVLDADQDDKNKSRWSNVNTMLEAKCAMKYLLQNCVSTTGENMKLKSQLGDLRSVKLEASRNMSKLEEQLKLSEQEHHENLLVLQRENEQKMLYLLCELKSEKSAISNPSTDEALKIRCQIQEEQIEKLTDLHDELQKKSAECEMLRKENMLAKYQGGVQLMPVLAQEDGTPLVAPTRRSIRPLQNIDSETHFSNDVNMESPLNNTYSILPESEGSPPLTSTFICDENVKPNNEFINKDSNIVVQHLDFNEDLDNAKSDKNQTLLDRLSKTAPRPGRFFSEPL